MAATATTRRGRRGIEESGEHRRVTGLPAAMLGAMMLAATSVVSALPEGEQRVRAQRRLDRSVRARFADRRVEARLDEVNLATRTCAAPFVALLRALTPIAQYADASMREALAWALRSFIGEVSVVELARAIDQRWPDEAENTPATQIAYQAERVLRAGLDQHVPDALAGFVIEMAAALPDEHVELLDLVPDRFVEELAKIPPGAFLACDVCEAPHVDSCRCSDADRARSRLRLALSTREHEREALRSLAASVAARPGFLWAHPCGGAWDEGIIEALLCEFADPTDNTVESVMRLRGLDFSVERELGELLGDHGREPHRWPAAVRALTLALAAVIDREGDENARSLAETLLLRTLDRLRLGERLDADLVNECEVSDDDACWIVIAALDLARCSIEDNGLGIYALSVPRRASMLAEDEGGAQAIVRRMLDVLRHSRRALDGDSRDEELRAYLFDGALALDLAEAAE